MRDLARSLFACSLLLDNIWKGLRELHLWLAIADWGEHGSLLSQLLHVTLTHLVLMAFFFTNIVLCGVHVGSADSHYSVWFVGSYATFNTLVFALGVCLRFLLGSIRTQRCVTARLPAVCVCPLDGSGAMVTAGGFLFRCECGGGVTLRPAGQRDSVASQCVSAVTEWCGRVTGAGSRTRLLDRPSSTRLAAVRRAPRYTSSERLAALRATPRYTVSQHNTPPATPDTALQQRARSHFTQLATRQPTAAQISMLSQDASARNAGGPTGGPSINFDDPATTPLQRIMIASSRTASSREHLLDRTALGRTDVLSLTVFQPLYGKTRSSSRSIQMRQAVEDQTTDNDQWRNDSSTGSSTTEVSSATVSNIMTRITPVEDPLGYSETGSRQPPSFSEPYTPTIGDVSQVQSIDFPNSETDRRIGESGSSVPCDVSWKSASKANFPQIELDHCWEEVWDKIRPREDLEMEPDVGDRSEATALRNLEQVPISPNEKVSRWKRRWLPGSIHKHEKPIKHGSPAMETQPKHNQKKKKKKKNSMPMCMCGQKSSHKDFSEYRANDERVLESSTVTDGAEDSNVLLSDRNNNNHNRSAEQFVGPGGLLTRSRVRYIQLYF